MQPQAPAQLLPAELGSNKSPVRLAEPHGCQSQAELGWWGLMLLPRFPSLLTPPEPPPCTLQGVGGLRATCAPHVVLCLLLGPIPTLNPLGPCSRQPLSPENHLWSG